jgi:murein DD-endopeptidase MepM/ murein hydrolase activator NlpD
MSTSKTNKNENKNVKALFSVICICIIALGLIVYFSTNSKTDNGTVNENTTVEETTEVQHAVTVEETTAKTTTQKQTTTAQTTTEAATMEQNENNTPYKSFYKYPLSEAVLNGYSEELVYDKTLGDYRAHAAVDFSGAQGDEVVAINDGLVLDVYSDNMYGTVVEIDHGGTLIAKYCGIDSVSVKKGDYVDIGNTIGTLGSVPVESAIDSHLHFECKYDSKTINPLDAMSKTE